jgi:hypothetical protein
MNELLDTILAKEEVRALVRTREQLPPLLRPKLSAPFLISLPEEWHSSTYRIMIVGQETFGWWDSLDRCSTDDECLLQLANEYARFDFAEGSRFARSPFWRAHRQIADELEEGCYRKVLWSNVVRTDCYTDELGSASMWSSLEWDEIYSVARWQRYVLPAEIAESSPMAIVFFTGPNYDVYITETFEGAALTPVFADKPERAFARIRHSQLPFTSLRTYHPAYLSRSGQWELISRIVELIRAEAA